MDFDSLADDSQAPSPAPQTTSSEQPQAKFDDMQDDNEKFGTTNQATLAGFEALGRGLLGPVATAAEKFVRVPKEDILARQKANPIVSGLGEAAGLGAGLLTGTGEAALMGKAGEAATDIAGLSNLGKEASYGAKVGSSAVQQAAEMAVLSGSDEVSKMLLNDPDASAESAISNVGMSAALGGAGGAFITGAVSPLWKATVGTKVESLLNGLRDHLNGTGLLLPEQTENALSTLGIDTAPEIRAGLSSNPTAVDKFNTLKEVQNKSILDGISKLQKDSSDSVMNSLGVSPEDVEVYSENEAGHDLLDTFKKEYDNKYKPIATKLQARDAEAVNMPVSEDSRLNSFGDLLEKGITKLEGDSPYRKLYNEYGDRILQKETIGGLDKLKTEINNRIKGLKIGGDYNEVNALHDIKSHISDFQEKEIIKQSMAGAPDIVNERATTNQLYREFADMSDDLTNHLGVGDFRGAGTLTDKLENKLSPEELMRKFSTRGNSDFIDFQKKYFPDTLKKVQENELKKLIKPAILAAKDETSINVKKLHDIVSKGMAGQKEYIESLIPQDALNKIQAARTLMDAIPNPKSSGTAGWMTKVMGKVPQSALAAVAMITDHNPIFGYLGGEMAQHLGRTIPDAINLSYLKFLGENKPVKSAGFKAMNDFFHNTYNGVDTLNKAASAVFEGGSKVLPTSQIPILSDVQKLDKIVTKLQNQPSKLVAMQNGQVGHYLPQHQAGLAQVSTRALQYLQSLKPSPQKSSPLDREIPPSKQQVTRYQRALLIAEQPALILQYVKNGSLQVSDLQDLNAMYPGLYKQMQTKLSAEMTGNIANKEPIPYKTKMGLSLFLGQPLDSSMMPASIQSSQAIYAPKQPPQAQGAPKKKGTSSLGKTNKTYQTATQSAENDRNDRD